MAFLNQSVTVSGLKGKVGSTARPMAGPASTDTLAIVGGSSSELATTAVWNLETGDLVIKVISDTVAGSAYTISFDLVNPSSAQDMADVKLDISGMCFPQVSAVTPDNAVLVDQGRCGAFNSSIMPPGDAPAFAGAREDLAGGAGTLITKPSPQPCTLNPKP